jgi:small-conductance mechanosensitive channel
MQHSLRPKVERRCNFQLLRLAYVDYTAPMKQLWGCGVLMVLSCTLCAAQLLVDVASQECARKTGSQQSAKHVYTNEDLAEASAQNPSVSQFPDSSNVDTPSTTQSQNLAKTIQSAIRSQKAKVHKLESRISEIERRLDQRNGPPGQKVLVYGTGPGAPGPGLCALSRASGYYDPYKDWCDEPEKLSAELDKRQAELKDTQTAVEGLQERLHRMGYGSAFYDPE